MKKPRCPKCHGKFYIESKTHLGRPLFQCLDGKCNHEWTNGNTGHPYAGHGVKVRPS